MGSGANLSEDGLISPDSALLREEVGESLGNALPSLCLYCGTSNSGSRIDS